MLLAIDIGNSSTKLGVFDDERLIGKLTLRTDRDATADDLKRVISIPPDVSFDKAIACSVVPQLNEAVRSALSGLFGIETSFVANDTDLGLKVDYEPLDSLGTDRLVNAFAAVTKYGTPTIVCSFGTATTIDVVSRDGIFLGGTITPGVMTMAEGLYRRTAKLPPVSIAKPESVIGKTTVGSIQSGIFYGYVGLVEGLISRILAGPGTVASRNDFHVIATGGFAGLIAPECESIQTIDENLLLDGLRLIASRIYKS